MQTGMIEKTPQPTPPAAHKTPSSALDKNAFLTLLVAQLKNQDPTQSQDPNQMVQQMTSFSSLEQMQNTNSLLKGMQTQNEGMAQTHSASLIGKHIRVASSLMDLKTGKAGLGLELPAPAKVSVAILDAAGKTVAHLDPGVMSAGSHTLDWDGKDAHGRRLPDGTYSVNIGAVGTDGTPVKAAATADLTVQAVSSVDGKILLHAGGKAFPISEINEISA